MGAIATIFWLMGALSPETPLTQAQNNLDMYWEAVAYVESDMTYDARNKTSSAKSYFQVTDGAFLTAKLRAKRMGVNTYASQITSLSYKEQQNLLTLDLYQRVGTNRYIRGILQGNKHLALQAYYRFHHTDPDSATRKRAERIFGDYYDSRK